MTNKYEMLKRYVNGVADFKEDDNTLQEIKDLMIELDKTDTKENTNLISQAEWQAVGYKERIEMKESNPERFNAAMAGKFKEEK